MAKNWIVGLGLLACAGLAACGQAEAPAGEAAVASADEAAAASDPGAGGAAEEGLPLKRGFYVATEVSCQEASNATLQLFRGSAMSTAHVMCEFDAIKDRGDGLFDVTMTCTDDGAAFGGETVSETRVETFEVRGDEAFKQSSADGWGAEFAYCAQPDLPEPWRDNDISDLTR